MRNLIDRQLSINGEKNKVFLSDSCIRYARRHICAAKIKWFYVERKIKIVKSKKFAHEITGDFRFFLFISCFLFHFVFDVNSMNTFRQDKRREWSKEKNSFHSLSWSFFSSYFSFFSLSLQHTDIFDFIHSHSVHCGG